MTILADIIGRAVVQKIVETIPGTTLPRKSRAKSVLVNNQGRGISARHFMLPKENLTNLQEEDKIPGEMPLDSHDIDDSHYYFRRPSHNYVKAALHVRLKSPRVLASGFTLSSAEKTILEGFLSNFLRRQKVRPSRILAIVHKKGEANYSVTVEAFGDRSFKVEAIGDKPATALYIALGEALKAKIPAICKNQYMIAVTYNGLLDQKEITAVKKAFKDATIEYGGRVKNPAVIVRKNPEGEYAVAIHLHRKGASISPKKEKSNKNKMKKPDGTGSAPLVLAALGQAIEEALRRKTRIGEGKRNRQTRIRVATSAKFAASTL